jgi:hypothetical protein
MPKSEQQPKCWGCGREIAYSDICIRHKYKDERNPLFGKTEQYHCNANCLQEMSIKHLTAFMNQK